MTPIQSRSRKPPRTGFVVAAPVPAFASSISESASSWPRKHGAIRRENRREDGGEHVREYAREYVREYGHEDIGAPLGKPLRPPVRRNRWQGFAEPAIFAVALVAALLAMNEWFTEASPASDSRAAPLPVAAAPR